jgi:hypothetical protein
LLPGFGIHLITPPASGVHAPIGTPMPRNFSPTQVLQVLSAV